MDELTAFERQLATRLALMAGPEPSVDVSASVRAAATATRATRLQLRVSARELLVAGVGIVLIASVLLVGLSTMPSGESVPASGTSASTSITAAPASEGVATEDAWWWADAWWAPGHVTRIDAATGEAIEIRMPGEVRWLAATDDAVWGIGMEGVYRIDRASRSVTGSLDIAGGPVVITGDALWLWSLAPDGSSLVQVDLGTLTVSAEYPTGDPVTAGTEDAWVDAAEERWIGSTDDAIWLHTFEGPPGSIVRTGHRLAGFDLQAHRFTDAVSLDAMTVNDWWPCCVTAADAMWLRGARGTGTLVRVDLATLSVTETLELGSEVGPATAAAGAIWITSPGTVHRIDPVTKDVTDIAVSTFRNRAPVFGDGAIWIAGGSTLSRVDVDSLEVSEIHVAATTECRADYTPVVADGVAWVAAGYGVLCRVDLDTGEVTRLASPSQAAA